MTVSSDQKKLVNKLDKTRNKACFPAVFFGFLLVMGSATAQITIETATIEGTAQVGSNVIVAGSVSASSGSFSSSTSISAGSTSGTYSLTVTADPDSALTYNVRALIRTDISGRDSLDLRNRMVTVSPDDTKTQNFIVASPGTLTGTVTVTGGNINRIYLYTYDSGPMRAYTNQNFSPASSSATVDFPISTADSTVRCYGTVYLDGGASVSLPNQTVAVVSGSTTCNYNVTAPTPPPPSATGTISSDIEFAGSQPIIRYQIRHSGPESLSQLQYSPFTGPGSFEIFDDVDAKVGTYYSYGFAWLNSYDDYFQFPYSAFTSNVTWNGSTPRVDVFASSTSTVSISACQAYVNGTLEYTGTASMADMTQGQVAFRGRGISFGSSSGGYAYDNATPVTGAFDSIVSSGEWRTNHLFVRLGRPTSHPDGYLSTYSYIYPAETGYFDLMCGEVLAHDYSYATGSVTIDISSDGTTFSNPYIYSGSCELRDEDTGDLIYRYRPYAWSTGQVNVTEGSVTLEAPAGSCTNMRVLANVSGSNLTVGLIDFDILPGTDVISDIGGPALTIVSPDPGFCIDASIITVDGLVTDDVAVDTVTVNGLVAFLFSSGNASDPNEMMFSVDVPIPDKGPNELVIIATDTSGKTTQTSFFIFNDAGPPDVSFTPANGSTVGTNDVDIEGTVTDDAGIDSIVVSIDGTQIVVIDGLGALEVLIAEMENLATGPHSVTISATDISEKNTTLTQMFEVGDTTDPTIEAPADVTAEATGILTIVAIGTATADDDIGPVMVSNDAPAQFPLGARTVIWTATDDAGNTATDTQVVTVEDTTSPDVTPPDNQVLEATSAAGAIATYVDATAYDTYEGALPATCLPVSGSTFPLGVNTVTCSSTDSNSNTGSASFTIEVIDTIPPVVTVVPGDITVTATMPSGAMVTWTASASDIVDGSITPSCTPASGSTFGHGTTPVTCSATDNADNTDSASFSVTVENARPTADANLVTLDEDTPIAITLMGDDIDDYPNLILIYDVVGNPVNGTLSGTEPNLTYTPNLHFYGGDSFTFRTYDGALYSTIATVSLTINPVNDAPVISINRATASLQYSDTIGNVVITVTDADDDPLTLNPSWTVDSGSATSGLPSDLGSLGTCDTTSYGYSPVSGTSCSWTFSGQMLEPSGDYDITFSVTDAGGGAGNPLSASAVTKLLVLAENASMAFDGGNPVAVQVIADGVDESEPFSIMFDVWETQPDNFTSAAGEGDISNAIPEVAIQLTPVGPGGPEDPLSCVSASNGSSGYGETLTFTCNFDAVPVNTYSVDISVNGGYYTGSNDDVLTVYDPSLGFTTGGGWFYWPGTTDKTNFGYTMKYNKKRTNIQGSLLLIRHIEGAPEGEDKWRIKSNSLEGLALGGETGPDFGWAAFSGKATYRAPGADNEGNHEFTVYVEDRDDPGTETDRFWVETRDKTDNRIDDLSMGDPATATAVDIHGGNIVVPFSGGGGHGRKK